MIRNNFNFTGELVIPNEESRMPFVRRGTTKNDGRKWISVRFGIKSAENNREFVELFGLETDTIHTFDTEGNKYDIDWADRFNQDVVSKVANYRKYSVNIGERKTFISQYDMAEFLADRLPSIKERVTITGQMSRDCYDGKFKSVYTVENVYAAQDKTANGLFLYTDIAYNKDCVDMTDWSSKHQITLNGFVQSYSSEDRKQLWWPTTFIFDADAEYNLSDAMDIRRIGYIKRFLDIPNQKYVRMKWIAKVINGTEEVDFDESMLTDLQKEEVALGISTVNDFKPRGQIYGNRVQLFRLVRPDTKGKDYANGLFDMELTEDEFSAMTYQAVTTEDLSNFMDAPESTDTQKEMENLFGTDDLFG